METTTTNTNFFAQRDAERFNTTKARDLKVGDIARPLGLTCDYEFDTIFEIDFVENNLFGIIETKVHVGLTNLDCFVVCPTGTTWEVKR